MNISLCAPLINFKLMLMFAAKSCAERHSHRLSEKRSTPNEQSWSILVVDFWTSRRFCAVICTKTAKSSKIVKSHRNMEFFMFFMQTVSCFLMILSDFAYFSNKNQRFRKNRKIDVQDWLVWRFYTFMTFYKFYKERLSMWCLCRKH